MDSKRIAELQKLVDTKREQKGNVQILAEDLCQLVELSQTDNEGLRKAAAALAGQAKEAVVVQAVDLAELLGRVKSTDRGTSGGSSAAKLEGPTSDKPAVK